MRVSVPVVVYNVPGRTGSNIDAKTQLRLAAHANIAAVKEASGNLGQIMEILRDRPAGFEVLSGDDAFTLPMMALGAEGVISVVRQPGPRADARADGGLRPRRLRRGAAHPQPAAAAHEPELRRVEPDPGEGLAGAAGPVRGELPAAAVPAHRGDARGAARRPCASWGCWLEPSGPDLAERDRGATSRCPRRRWGTRRARPSTSSSTPWSAGEVRAAEPGPDGWRVNAWVKKGILLGFRLGRVVEMEAAGPLRFFDKDTFPPRRLTLADGVRVVPGGSAVRCGRLPRARASS